MFIEQNRLDSTNRVGHRRDVRILEHDRGQAGCMLRNEVTLLCVLDIGVYISLCGGEQRVDDVRSELGIRELKPA